MSEYVVKYMQKLFYEGLTEKDTLKINCGLEWFNNCGVFIEDENNLLCKDCPLSNCIKCKDQISKEDYLENLEFELDDEEEMEC